MNEFEKIILQNMTILYVEDEPITRAKTVDAIKNLVGKLYTANNGIDGIKKFESYHPDILITDLIMPDMTGIELAEIIRKKGYDCPIIITSALNDTKSILQTVDVGIEKYIIKPIHIEELVEVLLRIGKKRLNFREDEHILNDGIFLEKEQRKQIEMLIRNMYTVYIKQLTGKGPKKIEVLLKGRQIEIKAMDSLTIMEKNLINTGYDYKMIDFNRNFLYKASQKYMEEKFLECCNMQVCLKEIEINSEKDYDKLVFDF